jgi:hypothetical protein
MFGKGKENGQAIMGKSIGKFENGRSPVFFPHEDFSRSEPNREHYTFHQGWVELIPPSSARLITHHEKCWTCKNLDNTEVDFEKMSELLRNKKARWKP